MPEHDQLRIDYLRHAFNVPAIVAEEFFIDVVARLMIEEVPGITDSTFAETLRNAKIYVEAFVDSFMNGEMDLPLAGFGAVVKEATEERPREELTTQETALATVKVGSAERLDWLTWLWARLAIYVQEHRFDIR
jgi:hypothetical protein